jgi:PAS domain S-box-containing protein
MAMLELRRALAEGGDAMTERLGAAQEAGRVGSFVVDLVSETAGVSAEFCRIFGLPVLPAYPVPRLSSLVIGADESRAFGAWERRSEEAPPDVEYRIRRPSDGAIRWIARHSSFERDAQGRPLRLLGTVQDITLRKAADARQAALVELGDELRVAATAEVAILGASRLVGETLSASRTGYAEADSQARLLNIRAGWTDPRAQPILGQYPYDLAPASAESLKRGATLVVPDIAADLTLKTDAELYSAIDVAALLAVSVRDEERVGAVFVHDRAPRVWSAGEVDFVGAVADRLHGAVAKLDSEGRQRLLNQELSHRLKNTLAIVQAMASQTLRGRSDPTALDAFAGRLGALGRAHDVLLQQRWSAARIIAVVQAVVGAVTDLDRFDLAGPDMNLAARIVMTLSLLLHELATNALKYGALSTDGGAVNLSWRIDDLGPNPVFRLRWEEKGGPSVAEPDKQGFGSRLIRAGLVGAGNADVAYRSDGLVAEFRAPLAVVSAG